MIGFYSPIWLTNPNKTVGRPLKIKFEMGERLKYCKRCDEWHPADTEFFNEAKSTKVGLSSWCRACNDENQNQKRYWEK